MNGGPYWRLLFTYETRLWLSLWLYVFMANDLEFFDFCRLAQKPAAAERIY
jgi:hypothetical protein